MRASAYFAVWVAPDLGATTSFKKPEVLQGLLAMYCICNLSPNCAGRAEASTAHTVCPAGALAELCYYSLLS